MSGFESDEDEGALHSVKFIEDVPLMMIVEIGRTEMEVQDIQQAILVVLLQLILPKDKGLGVSQPLLSQK